MTALRGMPPSPWQYERRFDEALHPRDEGGKFTEAEAKRREADAKFSQLMAGKTAADREAFTRAREDGITIPPAWTDVTYYGKDQDIWAEGRDSVGRKQRAENPAYRARVSRENNARISRDLLPRMDDVRSSLRAAAADGDEEAKVLYLMAETGFRIGGRPDPKAKAAAYGATTLMGQHVHVDGSVVTFDFPGKKGVRQQHSVDDPVIAEMMAGVKDDQPVFRTTAEKVRERWRGEGGKKPHDIRHVVATETALRELRSAEKPKTPAERKRLVKRISTIVSEKLGNTPAMALGTYIDPDVWSQLDE